MLFFSCFNLVIVGGGDKKLGNPLFFSTAFPLSSVPNTEWYCVRIITACIVEIKKMRLVSFRYHHALVSGHKMFSENGISLNPVVGSG